MNIARPANARDAGLLLRDRRPRFPHEGPGASPEKTALLRIGRQSGEIELRSRTHDEILEGHGSRSLSIHAQRVDGFQSRDEKEGIASDCQIAKRERFV